LSNCDVSDWFNPNSGFIKKETNNDLDSYISLPGGYITGYSIPNGKIFFDIS
jgi:hypothetical protein